MEKKEELEKPNQDRPIICNPDTIFEEHKENWYPSSTNYWAKQERNINGMIGGYPELSDVDLNHTRNTIERYINQKHLGIMRIADCGAGIGRVSKIFCDYFKEVTLIDPVSEFLKTAKENLPKNVKINTFAVGIQNWVPTEQYDAFWVQWAIMYLTDDDAIAFLKRCKDHLATNGIIFIKDNTSSRDRYAPKSTALYFKADNGICRSYSHYVELINAAGLKLVEGIQQPGWKAPLLPLFTFVIKNPQ